MKSKSNQIIKNSINENHVDVMKKVFIKSIPYQILSALVCFSMICGFLKLITIGFITSPLLGVLLFGVIIISFTISLAFIYTKMHEKVLEKWDWDTFANKLEKKLTE